MRLTGVGVTESDHLAAVIDPTGNAEVAAETPPEDPVLEDAVPAEEAQSPPSADEPEAAQGGEDREQE